MTQPIPPRDLIIKLHAEGVTPEKIAEAVDKSTRAVKVCIARWEAKHAAIARAGDPLEAYIKTIAANIEAQKKLLDTLNAQNRTCPIFGCKLTYFTPSLTTIRYNAKNNIFISSQAQKMIGANKLAPFMALVKRIAEYNKLC